MLHGFTLYGSRDGLIHLAAIGRGLGILRLVPDAAVGSRPKAWTLLTTLEGFIAASLGGIALDLAFMLLLLIMWLLIGVVGRL